MEPAKVADEYGQPVARVHEALAFYYDHVEWMQKLEDLDEITPATPDRDGWEGSTPEDAGEALFGDFDEE